MSLFMRVNIKSRPPPISNGSYANGLCLHFPATAVVIPSAGIANDDGPMAMLRQCTFYLSFACLSACSALDEGRAGLAGRGQSMEGIP